MMNGNNGLQLWPHQQAAIQSAHAAIESGRESGLWSMPCGCGKTIGFCTLASQLGWSALIMIHGDELIRQTGEALEVTWPGASVGVIQAERSEIDHHDVVIASVQSLHERRLHQISRNRFELVVADEAHHAVAPTWAAVLDHFDSRFVLGCTATPERLDGKALADRFGRQPLYSYPLRQAIDDGHLVRLTQYAVETTADLDGVGYRYGDFSDGALSDAVNTPARNAVVVESYQEHAEDRRALAFTVDVQHAHDLADCFNEAGIVAATVTGTTPRDERRQLLRDFAAGDIRVMTNCAVLCEGFDDRAIECVLMARPTSSRPLYVQCIGRGLRLAPDKDNCLVLDFVDNSKRHKLVTVLDLLGAPTATNANGGDVLEAVDADVEQAEREHVIQSTMPLRWRLASVCPWPELPSLKGYVTSLGWHRDEATPKQVACLRGFGVSTDRELTKGEASHLIDRCLDYVVAYPQPATSKQEWFLRSRGAWRDGLTKREASTLIGKLKARERETAGAL